MKLAAILIPLFLVSLSLGQDDAKDGAAPGAEKKTPDKSVRELANAAADAEERGDDETAISLLQQAIARIQAKSQTGMGKALPVKVGEFERFGDMQKSAGSWGSGDQRVDVVTITQTYKRKSDGAVMQVVASNSPQINAGTKQLFEMMKSNQQYRTAMAANGTTFEERGAWGVMKNAQPNGRDCSAHAMHKSLSVSFSLNRLEPKVLDAFIAATDLASLEK